jgi:threonylcarbamoyladenosine tRNA methylthiotransferase MtaB
MNYFHVFSYSKRKGTPAASFPDQVPEREKKARAQRLRELSEAKQLSYRQRFLNKTLDVIVEEGCQQGMSENYLRVQLDANGFDLQPNDSVTVRITHTQLDETVGLVQRVDRRPSLAL